MKFSSTTTILSFLFLCLLVYFSFKSLLPSTISDSNTPETEFSTERALSLLKVISEKPHYIGSDAHGEVGDYLISQLELLGLEPHVQEGFTVNKNWSVLAKPKNILARIPGTESGKALMLLAHYDSAPHSKSHGASDAGSGVVTILEGLRAFLATGELPKNDIIVLFSDAEEIGLMGAKLFVEEHPWINDVGIVVNFEARGSGGPSNMILETNHGNAVLIREFIKANPSHPVASSLMYSIYKMLPNDTDSTIFRELADIDSYFFAFIDDHFHYHTAEDTFENLDRNTLEHQGRYVMAILNHFTKNDLANLKAEDDYIYFNVPVIKMVSYSFKWIMPLLFVAILMFVFLVYYGVRKKRLNIIDVLKGFVPFVLSLGISVFFAYFGWKLFLKIYPGYKEILHGFTYNGHLYISFFVAISLALTFWLYNKFINNDNLVSHVVAPLFFWLLICSFLAVYLKGGSFFIIPVYFSLMMLFLMIKQIKPNAIILLILSIPAVVIISPLIQYFPVGLGLKMLAGSAFFTVLLFGMLLPVIGALRMKKTFSILFLFLGLISLVMAHSKSGFSNERHKPNSLVYFQNSDTGETFWLTYDKILDPWTKNYLGNSKLKATDVIENVAGSKYSTGFSYAAPAPVKNIPSPEIQLINDTVYGDMRKVTILINPKRRVNRIALYAEKDAVFKDFIVNGQHFQKNDSSGNAIENRKTNTILSYYVSDGDSLEIRYSFHKNQKIPFLIQEMSFDLLEQNKFNILDRNSSEMPKPFITTDAVILQKTIDIDQLSTGEHFDNYNDANKSD